LSVLVGAGIVDSRAFFPTLTEAVERGAAAVKAQKTDCFSAKSLDQLPGKAFEDFFKIVMNNAG